MAVFKVNAPDGNVYNVTAPDGTKEEDLYRYVQTQIINKGGLSDGAAGGPKPAEYGTEESYESENPDAWRDVTDVGTAFASGAYRAVGSIVGLGSYVKGLNVIADPIAEWLHNAGDIIDEAYLSDRQKEINAELSFRLQEVAKTLPEDASMGDYYDAMMAGGGEAYEFMKDHPAQTMNLIASSLPYIFGGGVIASGVKVGAKGASVAASKFGLAGTAKVADKVADMSRLSGAALGEGSIAGGSAITQVIKESGTSGEYDVSRLKTALTIPMTGGLSLLGGRLASFSKAVDPDQLLGSGKAISLLKTKPANVVARTVVGGSIEGVEETLQSGSEKYLENYGLAEGYNILDPALTKGVGGEAVIGGITGATQAAGLNLAAGTFTAKDAKKKTDGQDQLNEGMAEEIENFETQLDEQQEQQEQKREVLDLENAAQQEMFIENAGVLEETLNLVQDPAQNIVIPGVNLEEIAQLDPVQKALYYIKKLSVLDPKEEFISTGSKGTNTATVETVTNALESAVKLAEPGALQKDEIKTDRETVNNNRRTHAKTFPNEKEWQKLNSQDEFERKTLEIADATSQAGQDFRAWQDNPEVLTKVKLDTDPTTGLPTEAAIKAFLGVGDTQPVGVETYIQALDDHAQLEEEKLIRTNSEQVSITQNLDSLLARRAEALATGNTAALVAIELEASNTIEFTQEWIEAKHQSRSKKKVNPKKVADEEFALDGGSVDQGSASDAPTAEIVVTEPAADEALSEDMYQSDLFEAPVGPKNKEEDTKDKPQSINAVDKKMFALDLPENNSRPSSKKSERFEEAQLEFGRTGQSVEENHPDLFKAINNFAPVKTYAKKLEQARERQQLLDTQVTEQGAKTSGQFKMKGWMLETISFLEDAARRGSLNEYMSFKKELKHIIKKDDTRASIAKQYNLSVEEIFGKTEPGRKKVKVKGTGTSAKNPPRYTVEPTKVKLEKLKVNTEIQIPFTAEVFASLPLEEKYKRTRWDYSKLSDDMSLIDPVTNEPYLSEKGKNNAKDSLKRYRQRQIDFGNMDSNDREAMGTFLEGTDFAENYSFSSETTADLSNYQGTTAYKASATDQDAINNAELNDRPTQYINESGKVVTQDVGSNKSTGNTGAQVLTKPGNFKAGNTDDAKAKQNLRILKAESRKLKTAATKAEKAFKANPTPELEAVAKSKRKLSNVTVESIADVEGFKKEDSEGKIKRQREFNKQNSLTPGEQTPESLKQTEKENKKRNALAIKILETNKDEIAGRWNFNRTSDTLTFESLTTEHQRDWAGEVILAVNDNAIPDIKNQQRLMEDRINESYPRSETKSEKVVAGRSQINTTKSKPKTTSKPNTNKNTTKISSKTAALTYGKTKLEPIYGEFWRSDKANIILETHLKNKNWPAYQRVVDKRVANSSKSTRSKIVPLKVDNLSSKGTASQEKFEDIFRKLIGEKGYKRIRDQVFYFDNAEQASRVMVEEFGAGQEVGTEAAFVQKWRISGKRPIVAFILDRVPKGDELALFMHEVGSHLGLEGILSVKELEAIQLRINQWYQEDLAKYGNESWYNFSLNQIQELQAKTPDKVLADSDEHLLARYAVKRAQGEGYVDKKTGKVPKDVATEETVAFFVEGAIRIGIKPEENSDTGKLLQKFADAFMKFFGLIKQDVDLNINAQDLVNFAMGAAKVQLEKGFRFGRKPPSQRLIVALNVAAKRFAQQPEDTEVLKNWDSEIEKDARRRYPKDDKGKYVTNDGSRIPLEEWGNFQKKQFKAEKEFKAAAKKFLAKKIKDDGKRSFSKEDKENSDKEVKKIEKIVYDQFPHLGSMYDTIRDGLAFTAKSMRFKGDFINRYKDQLEGLKEANDIIMESNVLARIIKKKVDNIAVQHRMFKPHRAEAVDRMIELGTARQLWPALLTASVIENKTKGEPDTLVPRRVVTVDKKFKALFEKYLNKTEQRFVMEIFEHGEDMMELKREIVAELGLQDSSFFAFTQLEGPYAPLRRFGKHTVTLRSSELVELEDRLAKADLSAYAKAELTRNIEKLKGKARHFHYEHFPNKGQANKFLKKEMRNKGGSFPKWDKGVYAPKAEAIGDRGTADQKVIEQINAALTLSDMDKNSKAEFKRMLNEIYVESLQESSARQGQEKRQGQGIAGFSNRMTRSFIVNGRSEANLIANMKFGKQIHTAIANVRKNAKEIDGRKDTPDGEMTNVYNLLAKHYNKKLRKKNSPIVDSIASFVTFYLLTTSPTYHIQNGTQTLAAAVPVIAAYFGYKGLFKQLAQSYSIAHQAITWDSKIPYVGSNQVSWTLNVNLDDIPEEHQWAVPVLALLDEIEMLDLGIEQDLNETNTQDSGFTIVDKALDGAGTISHRFYQVPRGVEAYNRISTALTAYKMALDNPKVMKTMRTNALDFAIKITQDTQGDFTTDGAPLFIKWALEKFGGKLVVQYKKYPLLMIWNYLRAMHMAGLGPGQSESTREEKIIGRRMVRNLLMHTTLLSGIRGLPFITFIAANALMLWALVSGDEDEEYEPNDTDGALERKLNEMFPDNPKAVQALYRGSLAAFTNVDSSMKLSHDKIFSPLPYTKVDLSEEGFKDLLLGLLGASGAVANNMYRGLEFMSEGNMYRGFETISPKGLKDPMEAIRFALDGYTSRSGKLLAPPEDFNSISLMLKSLGIPTSDIVKLKWTVSEQYQIEQWYIEKEKGLRLKWKKANDAGNTSEEVELEAEFMRLQDGKDRVRGFFNDSPYSLQRLRVNSLMDANFKQDDASRNAQRELKTGIYKND